MKKEKTSAKKIENALDNSALINTINNLALLIKYSQCIVSVMHKQKDRQFEHI